MRDGLERLINAVEASDLPEAQALLDQGLDINARSPHGWTGLLTAARSEPGIVKLLLDRGADPNLPSIFGYTPLMRAAGHGAVEIVRLLLAAGADLDAVDNKGQSALDMAYAERFPATAALIEEALLKRKQAKAPAKAPAEAPAEPAAEPPPPLGSAVRNLDLSAPSRAVRVVPLFVSSTFRDMHAERDYLRDVVLPELQERLWERGVILELVDLRWGVDSTTEVERHRKNLHILTVCFAEIQRSRPYFISLLGDRYGWIPPRPAVQDAVREAGIDAAVEGRSLTELEILFALQAAAATSRFFCYLRQALPYRQLVDAGLMRSDRASIYTDEFEADTTGDGSRRKLDALKRRILDGYAAQTRHYAVTWNPQAQSIDGLAAWGKQVADDLGRAIDADTQDLAQNPLESWQQVERRAIEQFCSSVSVQSETRTATLAALEQFAQSPPDSSGHWATCLVGAAGCGKSGLLARLCFRLASQGVCVLSHFVGLSPKSLSLEAMFQRWLGELAALEGKDPAVSASQPAGERVIAFWRALRRASVGRRIVLVIDNPAGLAQEDRPNWHATLAFLCPPNVRVFLALPAEEAETIRHRSGVNVLELPDLEEADSRAIICGTCRAYHREISDTVVRTLLAKPAATARNARWLHVATEELNLMGREDFEQNDLDPSLSDEQRMERLLVNTAQAFPPTIDALCESVIERVNRLDPEWTPPFAKLLAIAPAGLGDNDLQALVPRLAGGRPDAGRIAFLRRNLRAHVRRTTDLGLNQFLDGAFAAAVLRRYGVGQQEKARLHGELAGYLHGLPADSPLRMRQLMFHLIAADDFAAAAKHWCASLQLGTAAGNWMPAKYATLAVCDAISGRGPGGVAWVTALVRAPGLTPQERGEIMVALHDSVRAVLGDRLSLQEQKAFCDSLAAVVEEFPPDECARGAYDKIRMACHFELGKICLGTGSATEATQHFAAALRAAATMSDSPAGPDEQPFDDKLALIYEHLGKSLRASGKIEEAILMFEAAVRALKKADGEARTRKRAGQIANSMICVGELHFTARRCQQALDCFQGAYRRVQTAMDVPRDQRELAMSLALENEGDVRLRLNDADGARRVYAEAHKYRRTLVDRNPRPLEIFNAAVSSEKLGDVLKAQGSFTEALAAYEEAERSYQSLATSDPQNAMWATAVATAKGCQGGVLLSLRRPAEARHALDEQLRLFKLLTAKASDDLTILRRYMTALIDCGQLESGEQNLRAAQALFERALAVAKTLRQANRSNPTAARDVSVAHVKLGIVAAEQSNYDEAVRHYEAAQAAAEEALKMAPADKRLRYDLAGLLWNAGSVYHSNGQTNKTLAAWRKCHAIQHELQREGPLEPPHDEVYARLQTMFSR